jgi:hypothetical protein
VSFSIVKNTYIICHYSPADLSMLSDFEEIVERLSIVKKVFVSLGKPLPYEHSNVYIRDTYLLAPGGAQSLEKIGMLYEQEGKFDKIKISQREKEQMSLLLKRDPILFEKYAIRDAEITLKHATVMLDFNWNIKQLGVPLTLSSVGRNYVFSEWKRMFKKYFPYQMSGEYPMGDPSQFFTPKGLSKVGSVGTYMTFFINNYKGGRNESFMYGTDKITKWYDYDLTSAYTTAMAALTLPDYFAGNIMKEEDFKKKTVDDLLVGYYIVFVSFTFHDKVKYPSIPVYIDKTSTVYPKSGSAYLTGTEYLLAKNQGCDLTFKAAYYVPPKIEVTDKKMKVKVTSMGMVTRVEKVVNNMKPFFGIIKDIQRLRREFPKGHINNLLYKEMGNSIYGNVVRGMSHKLVFDSQSGQTQRVVGTELSNPILASMTTAFIRSVIGECLHNIQALGGKIVSVTTDGFITDLPNLEEAIMKLPEQD